MIYVLRREDDGMPPGLVFSYTHDLRHATRAAQRCPNEQILALEQAADGG